MDAVIFGFLGSTSGSIVNHMKVRGYISDQKLQDISQYSRLDQLTQMRNRNAYEFEKDLVPNLCSISLTYIYIDVNGLHEINNENEHEYGDKMLKFIASEIKSVFTEKLSYRIGGDEFVAFALDTTDEELQEKIHKMVEK